MTGEALIHHFMNRLWMFLWTPLSPTDWEHTLKGWRLCFSKRYN